MPNDLRLKAETLIQQFNEAFWDENAASMPMRSTVTRRKSSRSPPTPGHCLWSGIVPKARAGPVVQRLMRKICGADGASVLCRPIIPPTILTRIKTVRFGRMTMQLLRTDFDAMATRMRRRKSSMTCAAREFFSEGPDA